ncbi:hypothetical protein OEZ86_002799 [Tetradesmus obliquus]|nr:hypothetical protein OEZ86_002799 [Tetradesmus obliquus]
MIGLAAEAVQCKERSEVQLQQTAAVVHPFRVATFNVLADGLAQSGDFFKVPISCLMWEHRLPLILQEVRAANADILCLQELNHFDTLAAALVPEGYSCFFRAKKPSPALKFGFPADGIALFYRHSRFSASPAPSGHCFASMDGQPAAQGFVTALLHDKQSGRSLLVAATHLKAKAGVDNEQTRVHQACQLLQELENVQERQQLLQLQQQPAAESSSGASSSRGVPPAVLLCGDFNTTPDSETVQVIMDHRLGLQSIWNVPWSKGSSAGSNGNGNGHSHGSSSNGTAAASANGNGSHWCDAQLASTAQFIPKEVSGQVPARLVFRQQGLAEAWNDPGIRRAVVRGRVVVEEPFWREQFAASGGTAAMGAKLQGLQNFTIDSEDPCNVVDCSRNGASNGGLDKAERAELSVSRIASMMLVGPGGLLTLQNIILSDIASADQYVYSDAQPYRSQGAGTGTWPTIALAPNATLVMNNITVSFRNPAPIDTCSQYVQRAVFSLRQVYPNASVELTNDTAGRMLGPVTINVDVRNGSTNAAVGAASINVTNMTFFCLEKLAPPPAAGGLAPGVLAAAVAVPVAVALLAAALAAWLCRRRRRKKRAAAAAARAPLGPKDMEAGRHHSTDLGGLRDHQHPSDDDRDRVLPLSTVAGSAAPGSMYTSSSATSSSSMVAHLATGVPVLYGSSHSAHSPGVLPYPDSSGGGASGSTPSGLNTPAAAAVSSAITFRDGVAATTAASGQYIGRHSTSSGASPAPVTTMGSIGPTFMHSSREPSSTADISGGGGSAGRGSGQAGMPASASGGGGGSGGAGSSAGVGGSGGQLGTSARSAGSVSNMLKIRSEKAVLKDLRIGPLLGRGSYGRVYKGRWNGVSVAVKIIEHSERSPGTASSGGKRISIVRESLLATQMSHPNIVQSYHISTMTVSERNALAKGWLGAEAGTSPAPKQSPKPSSSAQQGGDDDEDSSGSNHSSDNEQRDVLETWIIMEFCEKGSLERAVSRGKFVRREDRQPEMIGVYKALLDTASGLGYLHSIGVVHGDLKSANVLLKGASRDLRGFSCKIADFGLSRVLDMDATHISTRTYGTIVYMPSELLLTGRMTTATDVYSFGLMMWELITSQRVFEEGLSIGQIFYMIAYQNWRPTVPANCPPGYAELMTACWHQDPEQRPTVPVLLRSLQKLYVAEKQRLAAERQLLAAGAAGPSRVSLESDRTRAADGDSAGGGGASTSSGNTPQHTSGAAAGLGSWASPRQQQQQQRQQQRVGSTGDLQAAGQPVAAGRGGQQQYSVMQQQQQPGGEIEPALDSEALFSGGSAYPNISSSGNALTYGATDEAAAAAGYDDTSGFLERVRRPPMYPFGTYQQQQQQDRPAGEDQAAPGPAGGPAPAAAAAQGFLNAIEMASMQPGAAAQPATGWQAGSSSPSSGGQQRIARPGLPGLATGSSSYLASSAGGLHEWSSVSTGTMPSVLGDSSLTSPTSTVGSRALGSQEFHRITSFGGAGRPGSSSERRSGTGEGPPGSSAMLVTPEQREQGQRVALGAPSFTAVVSTGMLQTVPESAMSSENTSPSATAIHQPVILQQQQQQQQQPPQPPPLQQQQQEGAKDGSAAPPASPFAALAQRAGSLFGPLPPQ